MMTGIWHFLGAALSTLSHEIKDGEFQQLNTGRTANEPGPIWMKLCH